MEVAKGQEIILNIYGLVLSISSPSLDVCMAFAHRFSYFKVDRVERPYLVLKHIQEDPDYTKLPELTSSLATPRNITYINDDTVYLDYFGKGLGVFETAKSEFRIYSKDPDLAEEAIYLTVLSKVSSVLETQGLCRIHALGLDYLGNGVLLLLPSGGGKSTLALSCLTQKDGAFKLLSDDSPLYDYLGNLYPFPLSIGTLENPLSLDISPEYALRKRRMEYGPKTTISIEAFPDRLTHRATPARIMFLGDRTTAQLPTIKSVTKFRAFRHLLMNSVIGIGLYQGVELLIQKGPLDLIKHFFRISKRAWSTLRLVTRVEIYQFTLGQNKQKNLEQLTRFCEQKFGKPESELLLEDLAPKTKYSNI